MAEIVRWLKTSFGTLGFTLLWTMLGLLLAVLAWPLMVLAFVAMFCVVLISVFSPRVRDWLESPTPRG